MGEGIHDPGEFYTRLLGALNYQPMRYETTMNIKLDQNGIASRVSFVLTQVLSDWSQAMKF